ncbi:hypothetical protein, partial [Salmonella enterica]|uniref:hypothetical protein n=1 Tax=Salmonella enterica TaxID=28901 RepID=UPI0032980634
EDYNPLSTKDTGKIAPAAQGSGQLVQAAQVESVQPRVDAKSHAQFDQIQFDYNSADFANPAQALDNLEVVAEVMKRNPQARLVICGHTC